MLPNERRLTQHIIIRKASAEWVQSDSWVPRFASCAVDPNFIGRLSPWQRSALGMPPPGHLRWDALTLAATAARYGSFDTSPYASSCTAMPHTRHLVATASTKRAEIEGTKTWQTTGWTVQHGAERMWPANLLTAADQCVRKTYVPIIDNGQQRLVPNGAMGGQSLMDTTPFEVKELRASWKVESIAELPSSDAMDALAFAPSAVAAVAERIGCRHHEVRLCRSELVAIAPQAQQRADPKSSRCSVTLWRPRQYSLLESPWNPHRCPDGVGCIVFHNFSVTEGSGLNLSIEVNGDTRELCPTENNVVVFDVTVPHVINIVPQHDQLFPILCSILMWRHKDADWIGWEAFAKKLSGYSKLSCPKMSPLQRSLLGWPERGSQYWQNGMNFEDSADRYGQSVLEAYRSRL